MPAKPRRKKSLVAQQYPIRIVPMHLPPTPSAVAAGAAHLTYRNGPLLTTVQVFTVFWGSAWQQAANSDLLKQINQFFEFILTSQLIDQLGEYGVPGQAIGHGSLIGTTSLAAPDQGCPCRTVPSSNCSGRRSTRARYPPRTATLSISSFCPRTCKSSRQIAPRAKPSADTTTLSAAMSSTP